MPNYYAWKQAFVIACATPEPSARLWNLENDTRIPVTDFKDEIARQYDGVQALPDGAARALDAAVEQTKDLTSPWLRKLPLAPDAGVPVTVVTYLDMLGSLKRYHSNDALRPGQAAGTLRWTEPLQAKRNAGGGWSARKPFVWITFSPDPNQPLPDDPTQVKKELGLPHFKKGARVLRFQLTINPARVFIPTCLDAGLYAAWAPPPAGHIHPWGMTRDLTDGTARWPELVVDAESQLHVTRPEAEVVRPPFGGSEKVGDVTVDYMVGRV